MRMHSLLAMQGRAAVRLGLVSSYDPVNYCVKVRLMPEDAETGWLPIVSPWVGNGWGMFSPPTPGDMIEVQFQEDAIDAGFACMRFFNDSDRPLNVPSGEFWLVHKSGSFLKFHNDGTVELNAAGTLTSTAPQWNHTGPMHITGDVTITGKETVSDVITGQGGIAISGGTGNTITGNLAHSGGTLTSLGKSISGTHAHSGVTTGAGNTGAPV